MKKSKSTLKKEVGAFIASHSTKWNASKDKQLSEIIAKKVEELIVRTNDNRDIYLVMYLMMSDAQKELNRVVQEFRDAKENHVINHLGNTMFDLYSLLAHLDTVMYELHETNSFDEIYRKNQFYHVINRFVHKGMTIPKGFTLLFGNGLGDNPKHVLVDVDEDVLADDLFTAMFYGYFMPEPTEDTRKMLVDHINKTTSVDLLSTEQKEQKPKEGETVEKVTSSEMIEKYLMNGIRKREA